MNALLHVVLETEILSGECYKKKKWAESSAMEDFGNMKDAIKDHAQVIESFTKRRERIFYTAYNLFDNYHLC